MDIVEVRLLQYIFKFRTLSWREELAIRFPDKDRRRALLACAMVEVSGLKIDTAEAALKVMNVLPLTIVHRVFIIWRGSLPEPRSFTTMGLYKAMPQNRFIRVLEEDDQNRERVMDAVEDEMERKFGRKELEEAREIERQMAHNSKMRGATRATPEKAT